ncbi:hypothetical protein [Frankia sp. Cas3]|uniref:hypothetical protein n=1 Tax=Frankia sp. Cas3 TaxID=3073926 RepID=UPI002AD49BFE|nr:hypothetical protein [Frankia sp. Cas3]
MPVDWSAIMKAAGEVIKDASDQVIIQHWLGMDDVSAYPSIVDYVDRSAEGDVDRMDASLLAAASVSFFPQERERLVKFYAVFKIAEIFRFQKFRGFPA